MSNESTHSDGDELLFIPGGPGASTQSDGRRVDIVTFNHRVEIPGGKVLPAGRYVFKLLDSASDRNIVQIFKRGPNTTLREYPFDTELPFAADRQDGNDV